MVRHIVLVRGNRGADVKKTASKNNGSAGTYEPEHDSADAAKSPVQPATTDFNQPPSMEVSHPRSSDAGEAGPSRIPARSDEPAPNSVETDSEDEVDRMLRKRGLKVHKNDLRGPSGIYASQYAPTGLNGKKRPTGDLERCRAAEVDCLLSSTENKISSSDFTSKILYAQVRTSAYANYHFC